MSLAMVNGPWPVVGAPSTPAPGPVGPAAGPLPTAQGRTFDALLHELGARQIMPTKEDRM